MAKHRVPDAGDVVWLNFTPQASREQAGHRPAMVLSPAAYNDKVGGFGRRTRGCAGESPGPDRVSHLGLSTGEIDCYR